MGRVKWLIALAESKPLLFSIALLLLAIIALSGVIVHRENEVINCQREKGILQAEYDRRLDSTFSYYRAREVQLNLELRQMFNLMLEDYKKQLEEQKQINDAINKAISKNEVVIKKATSKIKNLQ